MAVTNLQMRKTSLELLEDCLPLAPLENPITEQITLINRDFIVTHTQEKRCKLNPDISAASIQRKTAMLYSIDMTYVAYLQATSLRLNSARRYDFLESCDAHSSEINDIAQVVDKHWSLEDVRPRSDILSLDRLCIHPKYSGKGIAAALMSWVLPKLAAAPIITILKAYPLQFEGKDQDHTAEFICLQNSLIDYYSRTLLLNLLPSSYGKEGWMAASAIRMNPWCVEL